MLTKINHLPCLKMVENVGLLMQMPLTIPSLHLWLECQIIQAMWFQRKTFILTNYNLYYAPNKPQLLQQALQPPQSITKKLLLLWKNRFSKVKINIILILKIYLYIIPLYDTPLKPKAPTRTYPLAQWCAPSYLF